MNVEASLYILLDEGSFSNIRLDKVSLSFPSDDESYNDHSAIEIVCSKDSTNVDIYFSSSSIPLDEDDDK